MLQGIAQKLFIEEGTNTPRSVQIAFGALVLLVFFQEFINYISPVSFRYFYFLLYAYFLFDATIAGLMKNRRLPLFSFAILVLLAYGLVILGNGLSISNVTIFISTTYPFVVYLFVRNNDYRFNSRFYRFFYALLLFITVFGFFEYFFAQYFLADLVARFGRGLSDEYLESGLYLQKINSNMVGIYRSMSFIMEFVYFGYFAMYCFFIAATKYFFEGGARNLTWTLLSFMGLASSVTMSAIGMGGLGLGLLILFKARMRTKLILGGLITAGIIVAIPILMNLTADVGFKPLLRVAKILSGNDAAVEGHLGVRLERIPLFGTSWRTFYEHEYFDAIYRLGLYGGILYISISVAFLWKAVRLAFRPGRMQPYAVPIALLFVGFAGIGFTHHTLQVGVSVLAFTFLAQIENEWRYGRIGIQNPEISP